MPRGVPHCSSQTDDKPGPKRVVFPNPLLTRYILLTTSWNKRLTRQLSTLTDIRIVKQIQNQKRKNTLDTSFGSVDSFGICCSVTSDQTVTSLLIQREI